MPRISKVYTGTGDDGTTGLADGQRVGKDSPRVRAYGTVDELNALIGKALAGGLDPILETELSRIQHELFHLGADLSTPEVEGERAAGPRIEERHVTALEGLLDRLTAELPPLENFVLPGGSPGAAWLHLARTVCRRAERHLVTLAREEAVGPFTLPYLNRLSDALFVMARYENRRRGVAEVNWDSRS
jgi:cob(I)alamin adenosyltransferase